MHRTMTRALAALTLCVVLFSAMAEAQMPQTPAPAEARVYFVNLKNGDIVSSPVKIVMGLAGMGIAPAGIDLPQTGHHHLIIDAPTPPAGAVIAADENHIHFGKGQTEVQLPLTPGLHRLQLVLGDRNHVPHVPAVRSETIAITVR